MSVGRYPDWVIELKKIFEPYLEGCHFIDGTPKEALEAFEKFKDYFNSTAQ